MPPSNVRRVSLLAEKLRSEDEHSEATKASGDGVSQSRTGGRRSTEQPEKYIEPSKAEFLDYLSKLIESVEW